MSAAPLVSVVCLCYNQKKYVREAIQSVLDQTYDRIELIVVDDASSDGSAEAIREILASHPNVKSVFLTENIGNCKAFNAGWKLALGELVIDLSADDVMHRHRIEKQVHCFSKLDPSYGVIFTDCIYVYENGTPFRNHTEYLISKGLLKSMPEGDVFIDVLKRYFISGPSMMIKNEVLKKLNGYDEELAYEDFDFWIRSSRIYKYKYLDERLTYVRKGHRSKSSTWYAPGDPQLHSTYLICQKAIKLCRNEEETNALRWRVLYEFKQSVFSKNKAESKLFAQLFKTLGEVSFSFYVIQLASFIPLPWSWMRKKYYELKY